VPPRQQLTTVNVARTGQQQQLTTVNVARTANNNN
jgi:hypothetical protein